MKEIEVSYTLQEIYEHIDDNDYEILVRTKTCRGVDENELLTSKIVIADGTNISDYATTYTALTSDRYLVSVMVMGGSYGITVKDKYFGLHVGSFETVKQVFPLLSLSTQQELIAERYLACKPEQLVEKLGKVLSTTSEALQEYKQDVAQAEEMLVNAHHNMKKTSKELFSKAWGNKEYWERVLSKMPWFKSALDKTNKG